MSSASSACPQPATRNSESVQADFLVLAAGRCRTAELIEHKVIRRRIVEASLNGPWIVETAGGATKDHGRESPFAQAVRIADAVQDWLHEQRAEFGGATFTGSYYIRVYRTLFVETIRQSVDLKPPQFLRVSRSLETLVEDLKRAPSKGPGVEGRLEHEQIEAIASKLRIFPKTRINEAILSDSHVEPKDDDQDRPQTTGMLWAVRLSAPDFERQYYDGALLGRNELRGLAPLEHLDRLRGSGIQLRLGQREYALRPRQGAPDCALDGEPLPVEEWTVSRAPAAVLTIGPLELRVTLFAYPTPEGSAH